jgi:hypothetical protein
MWNEIRSNVVRYAGAAGTVTVPPGGHVLQIIAHGANAGATVQIFNDAAAVPIGNANAYWTYRPQHLVTTAQATSNTIVFASTAMYLVEVALPAGA